MSWFSNLDQMQLRLNIDFVLKYDTNLRMWLYQPV